MQVAVKNATYLVEHKKNSHEAKQQCICLEKSINCLVYRERGLGSMSARETNEDWS